MRTISLAVVAICVTIQAAQAQQPAQAWSAMSTTAMSITGDIRLSEDAIRFQSGARLPIALVAERSADWDGSGQPVKGRLFRAVKPGNPKLLNNNRLCGSAVHYVVTVENGSNLQLIAYSGEAEPRGDSHDAICATFNYAPPN